MVPYVRKVMYFQRDSKQINTYTPQVMSVSCFLQLAPKIKNLDLLIDCPFPSDVPTSLGT